MKAIIAEKWIKESKVKTAQVFRSTEDLGELADSVKDAADRVSGLITRSGIVSDHYYDFLLKTLSVAHIKLVRAVEAIEQEEPLGDKIKKSRTPGIQPQDPIGQAPAA